MNCELQFGNNRELDTPCIEVICPGCRDVLTQPRPEESVDLAEICASTRIVPPKHTNPGCENA